MDRAARRVRPRYQRRTGSGGIILRGRRRRACSKNRSKSRSLMFGQVFTIFLALHRGCSDVGRRNFAANVGIDFRTPEEYFLHEPPQPFTRDFEPSIYLKVANSLSLDASPFAIAKKNALDIVLFCGSPGSGKSTFYRKHLQPLGYERVNQDTLKTVRLKSSKWRSMSPLTNV